VLRPATAGRLTVLTSAVSLAELLVVPHRDGGAVRAGAVRAAVEGVPGSHSVDVTPGLAQQAAALRATTGVRLPDALVLATAAAASARLLTNDARLVDRLVTAPVLVLDEVMPGALPPA
jgi:predicted nucleic acid-binding protein